jgi:amino acid adenylation domain-containing protein
MSESDVFIFPTSYSQQRLWLLDQLQPGNPVYNMPGAVRLSGNLNVTALEQTIQALIRRHETLRTTFCFSDGQPMQVVASPFLLSLPLVSLEPCPPDTRQAALEQLIASEGQLSFDLAQGPLLRVKLVKLGAREHVLVLVLHHIISDGWSMGVLVKELSYYYNQYAVGEAAPLAELEVQYADYAVWQREWLSGAVLEEQLSYWREQLGGAEGLLELPTDHVRPAVQSFRGASEGVELGAELTQGLKELSRRAGATLYMTLLAAFEVLLYRYTGAGEISVGTPVAGRSRREVEGLIGLFVNTLVMRNEVHGEESFLELLGRVREVTLAGYAHEEVPFEKVVEELRPERSLSHSPFFQVYFNMLNFPDIKIDLSGLTAEFLPLTELSSKFDFTMYLREQGDIIQIELVYNADLFDSPRMVEMLVEYECLLAQIVQQPQKKLAAFSLRTPRAEMFLPDPTESLDESWEGSVHSLFTHQARRVPKKVAVADEHESWTYEELDARSNQLARYLIAHGVQPQDLVAIYSHRSASLVLALLGIFKAGAAFLILDPDYPVSRLIECLNIAQPRGLLQLEAAGELPEALEDFVASSSFSSCRFNLPASRSDVKQGALASYSTDEIDVQVSPDDMAYVSFTSGTTGKPKGIVGRHGSLTHFLPWLRETFDLNKTDRFSMLSGLAHDPLHRDIFTPMQLGATVLIPDPEHIMVSELLVDWVKCQKITVVHLTPAMGQVLTGTTSSVKLDLLRYAFFVGDILTKRDVQRLRGLAPSMTCVNYYGSTETQRAVGHFIVPDEKDQPSSEHDKKIIPLGRGIRDVQLLVINTAFQLAGFGEVGDIFIRSPHVAKGYLNDDQLTASKFILNPFTGAPGDWLYKTGDLGRYMMDGNVEPLGRNDQQVKIRGYRIELGEIEAVLKQHEEVLEAAVVVCGDDEDKRLVAYVVPTATATQKMSRRWQEYLKERLPSYMIPSAVVMLEKLPLTANGKLDRKALPDPKQGLTGKEREDESERTAVEVEVAKIWAEVLRVEDVRLDDNFFDLGGHSLLATQVIARLRKTCTRELSLRELFECPTVATLSERIEKHLKQEEGREARETEPELRPREGSGAVPLSFAQQRLWFMQQLEPGSAAYNIAGALRLWGALQVAVLERAFNEVIRRHEALRTGFENDNGHPRQLISASLSLRIPLLDLSELPENIRASEVRRVAVAEAQRPFDLTRAPLLRVTLVRLSTEEFVVLYTLHHIVADGWSLGVLVGEVAALYEAFLHGEDSPLPELPIQYGDYAVWQQQWFNSERLQTQLDYWRKQLHGTLPVLELPIARPRPKVQNYRGAQMSFSVPAALTDQLRKLSQAEGVTLFITLLTAFQTLLHRYSGVEDVVVGTATANRRRLETEKLIGCFVNMLALRTDCSGNPRFRELLRRVKEVTLAAYSNQDVPFERVVEELQLERSLGHAPLFQVMLLLQNAPRQELHLPGLTMTTEKSDADTAKFDLTLSLNEEEGGLSGWLEYNTDLFAASSIAQLLEHFGVLLAGIVARPEENIWRLPLLSERERRRLLVEWNETRAEYGSEETLAQLFAAQVERTPDAVAVVCGEEQLSYRELDARANQLGHYLRGQGVGPEVLVGLCVERSVEMVAALLGILKAGGAYVPLDPAYPRERLAFMVADACVRVLLTQAVLTEAREQIGRESREAVRVRVSGANLAYLIYTSGSTGVPKGVQITQGAVVNLLRAMRERPGMNAEDRMMAVTTLSFDIAGVELYLPLLVGGQVVVLSRAESGDGRGLGQALERHGATVMQATPATWQMLLSAGWEGAAGLKILCGGEALPRELAERLLQRGREVWNLYGPTETTIWSARSEVAGGAAAVSIGRPLSNTEMYILDGALEPEPVGVGGELYIGGAGLSRGYWRRPELTAEKFVPDPYSGMAGARLYRTGDVVRYREDGEIEHLGRNDHQVKVRGFRVELGEIETVVGRYGGVEQSVVVAREDVPGDKRLVAYFTARERVEAGELRRYLKQELPDYMVPSGLVQLEQLPLTANGKLDRRALPAPQVRAEATAQYVAPRTETEVLLARIWSEVLRVSGVGVEDNFFELGGHSLLATQVMAQLNGALAMELPLRALFEYPQLGSLAEQVEARVRAGGELKTTPLRAVESGAQVALSFAQQRLWFLDQLEPGSAAYHIPVVVRLSGPLQVEALAGAFSEVVRRHEALRTTFASAGGRPRQVIHEACGVELAVQDLSRLGAGEREKQGRQLVLKEVQRRFDLEQGPLLRVGLVRLGTEEHILHITLHHIIADGWSMQVLMREMGELYGALSEGRESALRALPIQYADFAGWQREWLRGAVLEEQLSYWQSQLAGAPALLELPTDWPRPRVQGYEGAVHRFTLSGELSRALQELSRREGVTLFMTLLAAWQVLLARYSGTTDISVGSPIAGRTQAETQELIGFFCEHAGAADEAERGGEFSDAVAAGERGLSGSVCTSGHPV